MVVTRNFSDILEAQFSNLVLERPKEPKYIEHIYADFIELIALFSKEEVTVADVYDLLTDTKDPNIIETEMDDQDSNEIASITTEVNDRIVDKIISIFQICNNRRLLFTEEEYPFEMNGNNLNVKSDISDKQRIYLFLLLSSNLNYFEKIEHDLTKDFEQLSLFSLRDFLPRKAIVKSFGKNSDFVGNAKQKIECLSLEIGVKLNVDNFECISKHNVQERGLDIIAWIPFTDRISNMLIFLVQCACGKKWDAKQAETLLFSNYFYFNMNPIHSLFIPYALSNSGNKFMQSDRIGKNLLFDRKRILENIEDTSLFRSLHAFSIIEKCMQIRINLN